MSSIQSSPLQVLEDPLYATSLICMGEASQNARTIVLVMFGISWHPCLAFSSMCTYYYDER